MMRRPTPHLDPQYENDLRRLDHLVGRAGLHALGMVRDAVRSVQERDLPLARALMLREGELDLLEGEIDELCLLILARHAPVGSDLRAVTAALKLDTDIERVGDLAVNIAKRLLDIGIGPGIEPIDEILALGDGAVDLVARAVRALQERDADEAMAIKAEDPRLDALNRAVFERMIGFAREDSAALERALSYTSVARNLERIADHAVNIAEHVVFIVDGRVLRHTDATGLALDVP